MLTAELGGLTGNGHNLLAGANGSIKTILRSDTEILLQKRIGIGRERIQTMQEMTIKVVDSPQAKESHTPVVPKNLLRAKAKIAVNTKFCITEIACVSPARSMP